MSTITRLRVFVKVSGAARADLAQASVGTDAPVPVPGREEESRFAVNQAWYAPPPRKVGLDDRNIVAVDAAQLSRRGHVKGGAFGVLLSERRKPADKLKCGSFIKRIGARDLKSSSRAESQVEINDLAGRITADLKAFNDECFGVGTVLSIAMTSGSSAPYYIAGRSPAPRRAAATSPARIAAEEARTRLQRAQANLAARPSTDLRAKADLEDVRRKLARLGLAIRGLDSGTWSVPDIDKDEYWQTAANGVQVPLEIGVLFSATLRRYGPGSDQQIRLLKSGCMQKAKKLDDMLTQFLGIQVRDPNKMYQDAPTPMNVAITLFQDLVSEGVQGPATGSPLQMRT